MNALQIVRQPIIPVLMSGVILFSPSVVEMCSFEPAMPHTHVESHIVATEANLTYILAGTTASTLSVSAIRVS